MSLPMPLAAPVTIATLSFSRMMFLQRSNELPLFQIVVDDLAQWQGEVSEDMNGGNNLQDGQFRHGCQRMRRQGEGTWSAPGALDDEILQRVTHEFADPGRTVHMGDDFQQECRCDQCIEYRFFIQ